MQRNAWTSARYLFSCICVAALAGPSASCDKDDNDDACAAGEHECECASGLCLDGLECVSGVCIEAETGGAGDNPLGFNHSLCNPSDPAETCAGQSVCCSDDPAALNLDEFFVGALPDYSPTPATDRMPMFSGSYNSLGTSGLCIDGGSVGGGSLPVLPSCPVPCNPTWDDAAIAQVCGGSGFLCCQTVELETKDCIYDILGDCVRPVRGSDVFSDPKLSSWSTSEHATHQGPNGESCDRFIDAIGMNTSEAFQGCVNQLSVANQRGFCVESSAAMTACPGTDPGYFDACEIWATENNKPMCE